MLFQLGRKLGFDAGKEIESVDHAWIDVVWFDPRFNFGPRNDSGTVSRVHGWEHPVLPVAGFEIEAHAGAKPVKGSAMNLATLGAALNVVVLTEENLPGIRKASKGRETATDADIWKILRKRVLEWISETRVNTRIVVMTEPEVKAWAKSNDLV